MLLVSLASANAKCDWSKVKLTQQNNRNNYRFYLNGVNLDDTCIDYVYIVYTVKTGQIDTMAGKNGITDITFNEKGKYNVYLKIWDRCKKCDTTLVREVNIAYFNQCKYSYKLSSTTNTCNDSITAEMSLATIQKYDTCWQYYQYIYHGKQLDDLTQHDWDSMSDNQLMMYYDFGDSDLVKLQGPEPGARVLKYKFPAEGRYLVIPLWYNSCTKQDTFMFRRITVKCNTAKLKLPKLPTLGIKISPNPADDKVIFTVASTDKVASNTYEIYDSKGKLVLTGTMGGSICVGVGNLPNGTYIIKIGKLTQKFIVQH